MPDQQSSPAPVDAIRVEAGYISGSAGDKAAQYQAKFGPVLGTAERPARVYVRNQVGFNFLTADPNDTLYFPQGHAREKQSRYNWTKVSDAPEIYYGRKVPDESPQ